VAQRLLQLGQAFLGDVVPAHQEQLAQTLDRFLHQAGGFAHHGPAQVIQLLVDQFDDMKAIEHHRCVGEMFGTAAQ
jgi:hypothetical protein